MAMVFEWFGFRYHIDTQLFWEEINLVGNRKWLGHFVQWHNMRIAIICMAERRAGGIGKHQLQKFCYRNFKVDK